ncbi:MAG: hypothetical protein P4L50_04030 [Anaerolineaceae bacterium]|nr:hypothetical protein [Anaerolineaceae bacterium]
MTKKWAISIILFLLFGLVNCTGSFSAPVATDIPKAASQTSSTTPANPTNRPTEPVQLVLPTTMDTAIASTLSPTLTTTAGSANAISRNCLNILPALSQANDYQGRLILNKIPTNDDYYLYDFQTAQTAKLTNHGLLNIVITPDRKRYAYHDGDSPYLEIFSSNGQLQRSIPWEKNWFWMDGWLDNNQIMFEIPKVTTNAMGMWDIQYPEPLMLLNLATNQRQNLPSDYPDIDQGSNSIDWWSGTTVYDNSLSRVVYPGGIGPDIGEGYILWDVPDKKKMAELPALNFSKEPKWSPDGSKFIVNGNGGEFYIVTRDGAISKITNLNPDYDPTTHIYNLDSTAYSWSPDGRNVAFWLNSAKPASSTLAILDTLTGKIIDYCIQPEYGAPSDKYSPQAPVWSPDGNAFVVSASTSVDQPEGDTILVDIEKGIAAKVTSGLAPVGWLAVP